MNEEEKKCMQHIPAIYLMIRIVNREKYTNKPKLLQ